VSVATTLLIVAISFGFIVPLSDFGGANCSTAAIARLSVAIDVVDQQSRDSMRNPQSARLISPMFASAGHFHHEARSAANRTAPRREKQRLGFF
jgi:hypothetical protein